MKQSSGNVLECLHKAAHHLDGTEDMLKLKPSERLEFGLINGIDFNQAIIYRNGLVQEEIRLALQQLKRIKEVAEQKGWQEVLTIINEQLEFGHDIAKPADSPA